MNDHFYVCSNELLKSLEDGLDLRTSAAEYIIAFNNLKTVPTDSLYKSLKGTADLIIKDEKEEEDKDEYKAEELTYNLPEGIGFMMAMQHSHGEPTNHVWKDGLQSPVSSNRRHAVWPYYQPSSGAHPYQRHHFPFHETNHPLLRTNSVTGKPHYIEMLKSWALGGHGEKEKEMEKTFFNSLGKKHPFVSGAQMGGKNIGIVGDTQPHGTMHHHQYDLYNRDFYRWQKKNGKLYDNMLAEGLEPKEALQRMREAHFDARAEEWESNDTSLNIDTYEEHPNNLGHLGYKLGLEWFSPEERTAIMKHLDEKGIDKHPTITLPNGEKIPSARLTYNALMRMTPEMNWAIRPMTMPGRNAPYNLEDNDNDYIKGEEGMFLQSQLGNLAHTKMDSLDGESLASIILQRIKDNYKQEGGPSRKINRLPRLDIHKNPMKEMEYEELLAASRFHSKGNHKDNIRMTKSDLMYLAGYDPNTGELLQDHPIHGRLEEPLVNAEFIDEIESMAKSGATLHQLAKEIRNHRSFFTAVHGPHPDEDKPGYWQMSKDGDFTFGPGKFWSTPYQGTGGAGMSYSTYMEILHATHANDDGLSPLTELSDGGNNYIHPNPDNTTLANHFMPLKTRLIGDFQQKMKKIGSEKKQFMSTGKGFLYNNDGRLLQNLLSPFGVSKKNRGREGSTDKNNHAEHKSTLNPQYEYAIRHLSQAERKNRYGTHLIPFAFPHTSNPTLHIAGKTAYGSSPSDSNMHKNAMLAHFIETLGGRMNHLNTPAKKNMMAVKDFFRGDEAFSGGGTKEEFIDFMRWGSKGYSFDAMKNKVLDDKTLNHGLAAVNQVSKIIGSKNPKAILEFLSDKENHDELNRAMLARNLGEFDDDKLNESISMLIGSPASKDNPTSTGMHAEIAQKTKNQKNKTTVVPSETDAITRMLQFGGDLPASQKENELITELTEMNQLFANAQTPQEKFSLREEMMGKEKELAIIQQRIADNTNKKQSSHWEKDANRTQQLMSGHRMTVAQVAREIILPKYLEHDPDAFDPNNPQQFIDNNAQLFRDAQRYILSVPHSVHGIHTTNYGIDVDSKVKAKGTVPFHSTVANHLSTDGKMIDGNMSVPEVLKILNVEATPVAKEKARELIDASSKSNTPLFASTVKDILTSGKVEGFQGINLNHFSNEELMSKPEEELSDEERFYRGVRENGYHQTFKETHAGMDTKQSRTHFSHAIPRGVAMQLNPQQFQMSLLSAGLGVITGDLHNSKGTASKTKARKTNETKNHLDTIVHFDPRILDEEEGIFTPGEEIVESAGLGQRPVGAPNPNNTSVMDTFDSGAWHHGYEASPTLGAEFDAQGNVMIGSQVKTGLYHSVPEELSTVVHGKETVQNVWGNAPPPMYPDNAHQSMNMETAETASEVPYAVSASEMTDLITSMLDPDVLLSKGDDAKWSPPVRPMHRIFEMGDLEHLRGFSGSWVVSKWYNGKRIVIVRSDDEITAYDENGRKKGLRKATKEALDKMNDKNYTLDAILGEEELNIIDILNYDDTNVAEMALFERLKILRSQFDSQEHVIVPGPHDTRMTDDDGLEEAVKNLQDDHENILLRDNKSTYMRGERRHPKWIVYRNTRDFNFIVLDRRGKGPFTYQLGAGPILEIDGLGNRAIEHKGEQYMDVGTAHNQSKTFKIGDIVRASVTGISKKNRKNRPVYNVQFKQLEGEGEGEGAASTESLDLMTKAFEPLLIPHDIECGDGEIQIILKDIDTVRYQVEDLDGMWCVHSPKSTMGDMMKSDYPVVLAESLLPYWSSVAPLMMKGILTKATEVDMPKKPTEEQMDEGSVGILEEDDDNRILKPNQTKKALEIIVRALDKISKEKMTWTGPKGLGIDVGTPQESPRGPTQLRNESTLPDFDGEKKNHDEIKEKKKDRLNHIKVQTDEGEDLSIDYDGDQPLVSHS